VVLFAAIGGDHLRRDQHGNLYVADSFSGTVLRLRTGGAALEPG